MEKEKYETTGNFAGGQTALFINQVYASKI